MPRVAGIAERVGGIAVPVDEIIAGHARDVLELGMLRNSRIRLGDDDAGAAARPVQRVRICPGVRHEHFVDRPTFLVVEIRLLRSPASGREVVDAFSVHTLASKVRLRKDVGEDFRLGRLEVEAPHQLISCFEGGSGIAAQSAAGKDERERTVIKVRKPLELARPTARAPVGRRPRLRADPARVSRSIRSAPPASRNRQVPKWSRLLFSPEGRRLLHWPLFPPGRIHHSFYYRLKPRLGKASRSSIGKNSPKAQKATAAPPQKRNGRDLPGHRVNL